jgi:hypothetical protein
MQVTDISKTMHEMTGAMLGTAEKPGYYERVRDLETAVETLKSKPKSYKDNIRFAITVGLAVLAIAGFVLTNI